MTARGLIIAAPHSGAGKTTVTLAVLAALRRRSVRVRAAKAGPDYIDPAFHAAVTGAASVNLDSWAMAGDLLDALAAQAARDADLVVIEGVMGLFDGAAGPDGRRGATADLAAHFRLPVVLVIDVAGQAQSAAAVVRGFAAHDAAVQVAGVILNRVAGERHRRLVADAIAALGVPVLGALPRDAALALPERHLGLVQAREHPDLDRADRPSCRHRRAPYRPRRAGRRRRAVQIRRNNERRRGAAAAGPAHRARQRPRLQLRLSAPARGLAPGRRRNRAVLAARRRAAAGATPTAAGSPAATRNCTPTRLPPRTDFPPDCAALPKRGRFMASAAATWCSARALEDQAGRRHAMTGLLGHATSFAKPRLHLGYRTARLLSDCLLGRGGTVVRGHEFHYAALVSAGGDEPFAEVTDSDSRMREKVGGRRGRVTGAFFHAIAAAPS